MKKTKIICTMGPNTDDKNIMRELAKNGMDVARFNFSHGDHEEHLGRLEVLREVRKELDIPVAALLDTKGPEIRTGLLKDGKKVALKEGQTFTLTTRDVVGDDTITHINYSGLNEDVTAGNKILIDDGLIELDVVEVNGTDIVCKVVNGGELGEKKGVNVPNVKIKLPALTEKDKEDILFGIRQGFDFIAASFVRTADCIREIKEILEEHGSNMRVIAKIENAEGIENLDAIIEASDGIMVARGDMGVEIPAEKVPYIQKTIIRKCNEACKTVITATQMLDSMIRNPRPTRAEVTDVANAVYDGTDAVMLSGETAMGKYPVEALKMMATIVEDSESHLDYAAYRQRKVSESNTKNVSNAVCFASVSTAHDLGATAIIAPSISGFTTRMLSKWRPSATIIGMSPSMTTVRQMQLQWGVTPVWSRRADTTDELIESSAEELKSRGMVHVGDTTVITAGVVTYSRRHEAATETNIMRVMTIE
ncbi:MAG: pyruvate kinase [Lachnospiraceae bacterium]|uniref:Pyruvate kinase n=1 Tax=Candidatus Enterocloster excrementigallinarum TaxID=2838558 RepID=A0A9D2PRX4_9FIRM|nr:pyruvate kinase [Lachnospiraceae bacterium]HJC65303.1 pyruvate kinase [Candidatus Enterocloster excrementigallinarum]